MSAVLIQRVRNGVIVRTNIGDAPLGGLPGDISVFPDGGDSAELATFLKGVLAAPAPSVASELKAVQADLMADPPAP